MMEEKLLGIVTQRQSGCLARRRPESCFIGEEETERKEESEEEEKQEKEEEAGGGILQLVDKTQQLGVAVDIQVSVKSNVMSPVVNPCPIQGSAQCYLVKGNVGGKARDSSNRA